jgi:type I restriction enzyme S subunit
VSQINDLLEELSPDGVEYRRLASLGRRNSGTAMTASKMRTIAVPGGPVRIFAGGQTVADVAEDAVPGKDIIREPSIIVKSRGNVGFTFYEQPFSHKSELWSYTLSDPDIEQKFVYYYLLTKAELLQEIARATSVKLPQLAVRDTDNLRIPIPPIEVQREIVRVLDNFKKLEAELEAELEGRRLQYGYFRESLLTFPEETGVRWSTLGDISVRVSSGATPLAGSPEYYDNGTIPWLRTQEVRFVDIWDTDIRITEKALKGTAAKWIPADCVIVAISGATAGRSAVNRIPLATNQHCCNFQIDPKQANFRYVFYWVRSQYEQIKALGQGARADLNAGIIKGVGIPIPSLIEQERIVSILDKFDALVNDLTIGLPAELAARRKQYEYYRNRLLTFEEATA